MAALGIVFLPTPRGHAFSSRYREGSGLPVGMVLAALCSGAEPPRGPQALGHHPTQPRACRSSPSPHPPHASQACLPHRAAPAMVTVTLVLRVVSTVTMLVVTVMVVIVS